MSFSKRIWLMLTVTVTAVVLYGTAARAINIRIHRDTNTSENPSWDPNAYLLEATFEAAALIWEDLLPGGGTFDVNVEWDNDIGSNTLGLWTDIPAIFGNNLIEINPNFSWFYDATPLDHSEFDFVTQNPYQSGQWLYKDIQANEQSSWFNSNPPDLLEVGYMGYAISSSLQSQNDLLSVVLHELGHELGVNGDGGPYEAQAAWVNGGSAGFNANDGHLLALTTLMQPTTSPGVRTLPSAVDVMAMADEQDHTTIDLVRKEYSVGSGSWNTGLNWIGGAVPDSGDDAFIRSPYLNPVVELTGPAFAGNLFVGQGDQLANNAFKLDIADTLTIDGPQSRVTADSGGEIEADRIIVQNNASLTANGLVDTNVLTIDQDSELYGSGGTVAISQSLVNDGTIYATGGTLLIGGVGTYWDLDGGGGDGILSAVAGSIAFQIGSPLADDFNGTIVVGQGKWLASAQPFVLASGAEIQLNGGTTAGTEANLNVALSLQSSTATIDVNGLAENHSDFNMVNGSVNLAANAILELSGSTVVSGGTFNVASGAKVQFQSDTELSGGSFSTTGTGNVELNGATEYLGGTLNVGGRVSQNGVATVSAATAINGSGDWDMDGSGGDTVWNVNDDLTLNMARLDNVSSNDFDGRIYLSGSGTTMTVNTSIPWRLDDRLTLGDGTVLAGSAQMNVTGSVIAQSARIDAPVAFKSGSSVSVAVGKVLQLDGTTYYEGGSYAGGGTLQQDGTANVLESTTIGTNVIIYPPTVGPPTTLLWLEEFDWDGSVGAAAVTNISPGATLTINAVKIDGSPASDGFDGTVNINGGALIVNTGPRIYDPVGIGSWPVAVAPAPWLLEGTMNLQESGGNTAVVTAQYGSPMQIHGEVNATGGAAIITGMIPTLAADGQITVLDGADLSVNNGLIAAGTIDVRPGGQIHINGGNLQPSVQLIIDGTAELSGSTFQGGSYEGTGLLRLLDNANFAQTTLLEISTEFTGGGTNTIDTGKELQLASGGQIEAGAVFQGSGTLRNLATSTLALLDGSQVDVLLINEGVLTPGNTPGSAVVDDYSQMFSGVLEIELYGNGGTPGVDFDQLIVNNTATLGGTLEVLLRDEFVPSVDDTFDFLDWSTLVGTFDEVLLPGNLQWNIDDLYTSGQLVVASASYIPGDANGDGTVNVSDLGILATYYDTGGDHGWDHADFTGDGFVNVSDLGILATHYGETAPVASVPEPSTLTLLATCGLMLVGLGTRRRNR